MELLFDFEDIKDPDIMKFAKTKLKAHVINWWKEF